jgi:hypothetical protein
MGGSTILDWESRFEEYGFWECILFDRASQTLAKPHKILQVMMGGWDCPHVFE